MSVRSRAGAKRQRGGERGRTTRRPAVLAVRPAHRSDLAPLSFFFDTVLRRDYFLRRGQLEDLISGRYHRVYIAELDGVLVGVAITTGGSRLVNALVHPAYRGLGIGRELVKQSGATEVLAKLDMTTGDPRAFYRSMGFVSTGVRNRKGNVEVLHLAHRLEGDSPQKDASKGSNGQSARTRNNGIVAATGKSRK